MPDTDSDPVCSIFKGEMDTHVVDADESPKTDRRVKTRDREAWFPNEVLRILLLVKGKSYPLQG